MSVDRYVKLIGAVVVTMLLLLSACYSPGESPEHPIYTECAR
jgi:hypothetical protein